LVAQLGERVKRARGQLAAVAARARQLVEHRFAAEGRVVVDVSSSLHAEQRHILDEIG
jgi:hypothetical protein